MIPISKLEVDEKAKKLVFNVLDSGMLVMGPRVEELEQKFATMCGTKYAIAVSNGTAALHTALFATGIQPGDEIITTPFTFGATVNSILMIGAKPVYADIDEKTFNINPDEIEKKITKKTKAIMPVNLYGQPADYAAINRIAKKHNLLVVEDAAQSVNAHYKKKVSGNLANIACFSLYATKNIMCGEGGMITTNNKLWYKQAKLFRHHGMDPERRYQYEMMGYNYRLSDLHAAVGLAQMQKVEVITKKRQKNAEKYDSGLKNIKGIITPYKDKNVSHVYHQYTLRITSDFKLSRDALQKDLLKKGIQSIVYYPKPLYHFPYLKFGANPEKFPVVEKIVQEVLSIPVHPALTDAEVATVIRTLKSYE